MNRPKPIRRPSARSGLTLIETLAAVALLAAIASATLGTLRGLRTRAASPSHDASEPPAGTSEIIADALLQSPGRFGLQSHRDLVARPTPLTLDDQLILSCTQLARLGEPHLNPRLTPAARAWIVESPGTEPASRTTSRSGDRPRHTMAPCGWLVVQIGDDIATRAVVLSPRPTP